jgi:hypothetical protein
MLFPVRLFADSCDFKAELKDLKKDSSQGVTLYINGQDRELNVPGNFRCSVEAPQYTGKKFLGKRIILFGATCYYNNFLRPFGITVGITDEPGNQAGLLHMYDSSGLHTHNLRLEAFCKGYSQ